MLFKIISIFGISITSIKSIIYRPGIYNLQTITLTFPEQEKLLEKVNLRYLKTPKTKKLNSKNP